MADVKKIALNTIGAPKKDKKSKSAPKTLRFTLTLGESNDKTCPEFNYKELLAGEERRALKKEAAKNRPLHQNGNVTINDIDEEDEDGMRALARKFEEKYGGTDQPEGGKKRKKKKNEQYVDLGAGYDDNDSFIDNTDAYDEIVPEEMTTAQGGFYINCGALEYKQLEMQEAHSDGEETVRNPKKVKRAIISSDESSSEDEDDEEEDEDEDSGDEVIIEETKSQSKPQESQSKPVQHEKPDVQISQPKPQPKPQPTPQIVQPASVLPPKPIENKKLKRPAEISASNAGPSKKKSTTVKDLLKEKRDYPEPKEPAPVTANVAAQQKVSSSSNSIADSIESVINAAWLKDESNVLLVTASTPVDVPVKPVKTEVVVKPPAPPSKPEPVPSVPIATASPTLPTPPVVAATSVAAPSVPPASPARLPENLPDDVRNVALSLRTVAKQGGGNPAKFFGSNITKFLIRLDQKTQALSCRKEVFAYVAEKVICSAEGLMKKARKLTLGRERARAKEPLSKLKAAIDQIAPTVIETYKEDCQKFNENRFANGGKGEWGKISPPVQAFPWTQDIRILLMEAVAAVARMEDKKAMVSFLENQVQPLWPSGWMTLPSLMQEVQNALRPKKQSPSINDPVPTTPPPQRSTSVITLAESPRLPDCTTLTPTPPRPPQPHAPISLKQRILQDAVDGAFEPAVLIKQEEDVGLNWQSGKSERPSPPPRPSSSDSVKQRSVHSPSPSSRDKIIAVGESSISNKDKNDKKSSSKAQIIGSEPTKEKDSKNEILKSSTSKSTVNSKKKKKWPGIEMVEIPKEVNVPPPPTQEELDAKILEDKNKLIEETAAATDFLSQIIHQSLSGFPNASNFASNVSEARNHSPPKVENPVRHIVEAHTQREESTSPREIIVDDRRERKLSLGESSSSSARTTARTPEIKLQQEPPAVDPELSVQLEMKRVMQELMELNGLSNATPEPPKVSPHVDRVKGRSDRVSPARSLSSPDRPIISPNLSITSIDKPRSRVDKARNLSGSSQFNSSHIMNNSDLVITPTLSSSFNSNNNPPSHQPHALLEKSGRNSGVSVIAVNSGASRSNQHNLVTNPMLGFQEEFQRHLMQEPEVVYVSSSPPSAFRPSPNQAIPSLSHSHIPYSSLHGQQMSQQHQLPSVTNQELRNSIYNYSQMQGSLQQQLLNHRVRHFPDLQQQPK